MRARNFGVVLVAVLAMTAVAASAANASEWYIGATKLSGSESVKLKAAEKFTLESKVLGANFRFTATTLECEGCTISNPGAKSAGVLSFSGISVDEPTGCSVASPIRTNALVDEVIMNPSGGEATFDKFTPAEGTTFVTIKITGCAAAGSYPLKGSFTGRTNNTGVAAVEQPITFNAAEQATGGGILTWGPQPANLTGKALSSLSGANAGNTFNAH